MGKCDLVVLLTQILPYHATNDTWLHFYFMSSLEINIALSNTLGNDPFHGPNLPPFPYFQRLCAAHVGVTARQMRPTK